MKSPRTAFKGRTKMTTANANAEIGIVNQKHHYGCTGLKLQSVADLEMFAYLPGNLLG